jgi:hypothetical protein
MAAIGGRCAMKSATHASHAASSPGSSESTPARRSWASPAVRRSGERLLDLLRLGEVARVVRDDEGIAQVNGEGARAFGTPASTRFSAYDSPAASSGQPGLRQIQPQPSSSSVLTLGDHRLAAASPFAFFAAPAE